MPRGTNKNALNQPRAPGWLWLLTGLAIGLLVALLVYLSNKPDATEPKSAPPARSAAPATRTPPVRSQPAAPAKDDYDFHTLLEDTEVIIPESELRPRSRTTRPQQPAAEDPAVVEQPAVARRSFQGGKYLVQAGSFRQSAEAEGLKARLALLGIESSTQTVRIKQDTWHRVRIGPLSSTDEIAATLQRLRRNKIKAIVVQVKD